MAHSNPWVPQAMKDAQASGVRRSVAALMDMIDTEDPAFREITNALKELQSAGVELDAAAVSIAVRLGQNRHANRPQMAEEAWKPERRHIVYYAQRGDLIKIGTTGNPEQRFSELRPDAILAYEPGDADLETRRHRQFRTARASRRGEYFRPIDALITHIAEVRQEHGDPDPRWATTQNITNGFKRTRFREPLPALKTGVVVTTAEGAKRLRIAQSTIQGWAHRGLVKAVGKNEAGLLVYPLEHLEITHQRNHDWFVAASRRNRTTRTASGATCARGELTVT